MQIADSRGGLPRFVVGHSGADPVYRSERLDRVVWAIHALTHTDDSGRRYFRSAPHAGLRRLCDWHDFEALNRAIDKFRVQSPAPHQGTTEWRTGSPLELDLVAAKGDV